MGAFALGSLAASIDDMIPLGAPSVAAGTQVDLIDTALAEVEREIDALGGHFDPADERAAGRDEGYAAAIEAVRALRRRRNLLSIRSAA